MLLCEQPPTLFGFSTIFADFAQGFVHFHREAKGEAMAVRPVSRATRTHSAENPTSQPATVRFRAACTTTHSERCYLRVCALSLSLQAKTLLSFVFIHALHCLKLVRFGDDMLAELRKHDA